MTTFLPYFFQHSRESFRAIHVPKLVIRSFRLIFGDHPLLEFRGVLLKKYVVVLGSPFFTGWWQKVSLIPYHRQNGIQIHWFFPHLKYNIWEFRKTNQSCQGKFWIRNSNFANLLMHLNRYAKSVNFFLSNNLILGQLICIFNPNKFLIESW